VTVLESSITKATPDIKNSGMFNDVDGNHILDDIELLEPVILSILRQMSTRNQVSIELEHLPLLLMI